MLKTASVTELRSGLATYLEGLQDGPLLILSHSRPAAMLIEPELFDNLVERVELLEDLLDGRKAISEYLEDPAAALDAEEVFERLGK